MGDLPRARLTPHEPPFIYTGLDFFGPFYVKRGRGTEKVYGCIFVGLTLRAIHIEDVGHWITQDRRFHPSLTLLHLHPRRSKRDLERQWYKLQRRGERTHSCHSRLGPGDHPEIPT